MGGSPYYSILFDLDPSDGAAKLGDPLLRLLLVELRVGELRLRADHLDPLPNLVRVVAWWREEPR